MNKSLNSTSRRFGVLLAIALLGLILTVFFSISPVQSKGEDAVDDDVSRSIQHAVGQLRVDSDGMAQVTYSRSSPAVSYVRLDGALVLTDGSSALDEVMAFFDAYGAIFGMTDADTELGYMGAQIDDAGNTHLSFQQAYQGVPVFAGVLRVHLNPDNAITSINGVFVPGLSMNVGPTLDAAEAGDIALTKVGETKDVSQAQAVESNLVIFRTGLVQGIYGTNHLAYGVEVGDGLSVREFVYLDAHSGRVLDQYTGIHEAKDRETWDAQNGPAPGGVVCRDEGDGPSGDLGCDEAHDYAGDTYDYFNLGFGRDSLDDMGMQLLSYVHVCPAGCPWNNAQWTGTFMQYGTNPAGRSLTADDTVAHEFGHGITEFTSGLIYAWQPGAANEALSDIYGETVDLLNGAGIDTPDSPRADFAINSTGTYPGAAHCVAPFGWDDTNTYTNVRWLQGENDWLIRDMWAPSCMGDPDHVSHPNYHCSASDSGGVHSNSGVVNHHYALLVDGGAFNGQTITGLGLTKAGAIYYQAQTMYLNPASNFSDLENALNSACSDLVGTDPNDPTTGNPSGSPITAADCTEVAEASVAVEYSLDPAGQCGFEPLLDPNAPELCSGEQGAVSPIFSEDFESDPAASWTLTNMGVYPEYTPRDWEWQGGLPDGRPGMAMFGLDDINLGDCTPGSDDQSGVMYLDSPEFTVPAAATIPRMAFDHWHATEAGWDGGNVQISVNGGAWTVISATQFIFNPYNDVLNPPGAGNTNPLAGHPAFTGSDGGEVSGSWGQSQIKLSAYAQPGDSVQIRYALGVDGCNGLIGWYIDDVEVFSCSAEPTGVSLTGFDEGAATAVSYTTIWLAVVLSALVGLGIIVRRRVAQS